jgi:hypothetical protein
VIIITHLTQPARGAVIALYCEECGRTTFMVDFWAVKPERGDYWGWKACPDNPLHGIEWKHNTRLQAPLVSEFVAENILPSIY